MTRLFCRQLKYTFANLSAIQYGIKLKLGIPAVIDDADLEQMLVWTKFDHVKILEMMRISSS